MATISEALALAIEHHRAGRLDVAERVYRRILAVEPNHADAIHLLGVIANQTGQHEAAVQYMEQAISIRGTEASFHNNLGEAQRALGRKIEAIACYRRALELKPDSAEIYNNLGNVMRDLKHLDDAVGCYHRALALEPENAAVHCNLGIALTEQKKLDEAIACFRRSLSLRPDFAEAHNGLGNVLTHQDNWDEAIRSYRRACELQPEYAEAHYNLARTSQDQGELEEADAYGRRALELKPGHLDSLNNLANVLVALGKLDEALFYCDRALTQKPDFAEAHVTRAYALHLAGDFENSWREYEWRWRLKGGHPVRFLDPIWDGRKANGKTILLHAEQGLGDTIQFIRYAALVQERGATVVVECPKPLVPLFEECPGIDELYAKGDPLPHFDAHIPLMSLPLALQTTLDTVPANVPYLFSKPALVELWRHRLSQLEGFKIGIIWQGNTKHLEDRFRSVQLEKFRPLAAVPGVHLISLQHGSGNEQLPLARELFPVTDLGPDLHRGEGSFLDMSAAMKNVDLVITVDTSLAHLAGALGVPVWVAMRYSPDWRWMLDRADSPWYPTMRLFRQKTFGDWAGVFADMQAALFERVRAGG